MFDSAREEEVEKITLSLKLYIYRGIYRDGDLIDVVKTAKQHSCKLEHTISALYRLEESRIVKWTQKGETATVSFRGSEIWELSMWLSAMGPQLFPKTVKKIRNYVLSGIANDIEDVRQSRTAHEAARSNSYIFKISMAVYSTPRECHLVRTAIADHTKYMEFYLSDNLNKLGHIKFLEKFLESLTQRDADLGSKLFVDQIMVIGRNTRDRLPNISMH